MTGKSRENKNLQTSQKEWKLLIVSNFHYYPTLFHVGMRRLERPTPTSRT